MPIRAVAKLHRRYLFFNAWKIELERNNFLFLVIQERIGSSYYYISPSFNMNSYNVIFYNVKIFSVTRSFV